MSKFRFEWKRNCEENGIWNLEKSAGDTKREFKLEIAILKSMDNWTDETPAGFCLIVKYKKIVFNNEKSILF